MRVAMVTMNAEHNYGAALQAYALQEVIRGLGHDPAFVDQRLLVHSIAPSSSRPRDAFLRLQQLIHHADLKQGRCAFDSFVNDYQRLTSERYASYSALAAAPPDADVYLTGSDQVWNTLNYQPINFLEFAPEGERRISYAASLGVDFIAEDHEIRVQQALSQFDAISVREKSAVRLLAPLVSQPVHVHVDPVLLLSMDEWRMISKPVDVLNEPYILVYVLYRPEWLNAWLKRLHRETGMSIVLVDVHAWRNIYRNRMIRSAGPREFLWLFDNASTVVTSSFHGTAFSVVFEKDFYALPNPSAPSRIRSLLSLVGLERREVNEITSCNLPERIDYAGVRAAVARERERALGYLRDNLA